MLRTSHQTIRPLFLNSLVLLPLIWCVMTHPSNAQFRGFGGSVSGAIRGMVPSRNSTRIISGNRTQRIPSVISPSRTVLPARPSLGQQVGQAVVAAAMETITRPGSGRVESAPCVRPAPPAPGQPTYPVIIEHSNGAVITHTPVSPDDTVVAGRPQPEPSQDEQTLIQIRDFVAQAKQSFQAGDYDRCVEQINLAMQLAPEDADLLQFRGFAFFAANQIDSAAADAYDALLIGQTWNWNAVKDLYGSKPLYEMHLRRLEMMRRDQPSMVTHFALAYQYLTLNHLERGRKELQRALEFQPEEPLMVQLVSVVDQAIDNQ
ncbi:MAG: hypothetical protein AAGJ83_08530 [Planctomycetota bacterium]